MTVSLSAGLNIVLTHPSVTWPVRAALAHSALTDNFLAEVPCKYLLTSLLAIGVGVATKYRDPIKTAIRTNNLGYFLLSFAPHLSTENIFYLEFQISYFTTAYCNA